MDKEALLADVAKGIKWCSYCNERHPLSAFNINRRLVGGYTYLCKKGIHERYVKPNRGRILQRCKRWQRDNPEQFKKSYQKQNQKVHRRLRNSIRRRIKQGLDTKLPSDKHVTYLGCSICDLKAYIETLFQPGMTWANYGLKEGGWSIDHTIPYSAFDPTNEQHLGWCWSYRNLRPLWSKENVEKSDLIQGTSVRHYRVTGRETELHTLVGSELERLGITTIAEYQASVGQTVIEAAQPAKKIGHPVRPPWLYLPFQRPAAPPLRPPSRLAAAGLGPLLTQEWPRGLSRYPGDPGPS